MICFNPLSLCSPPFGFTFILHCFNNCFCIFMQHYFLIHCTAFFLRWSNSESCFLEFLILRLHIFHIFSIFGYLFHIKNYFLVWITCGDIEKSILYHRKLLIIQQRAIKQQIKFMVQNNKQRAVKTMSALPEDWYIYLKGFTNPAYPYISLCFTWNNEQDFFYWAWWLWICLYNKRD